MPDMHKHASIDQKVKIYHCRCHLYIILYYMALLGRHHPEKAAPSVPCGLLQLLQHLLEGAEAKVEDHGVQALEAAGPELDI